MNLDSHIRFLKEKILKRKFHRAYYFIICTVLSSQSLFAVLAYSMVVSTPGFVPNGAAKTVIPNFNWFCVDQMVSDPINIGFTFTYDGTGYTQFEVSDNGQLFLGAPGISCNSGCGATCVFPNGIEPANLSSGVNRPAICPLWDDMGFNVGTAQVNYLLSGSAPNRVMTVEWLFMDWKYNNTNAPHGGISFQVKLFESPLGQIDFIYRQDAQALGAAGQAPNARIGLMGATGDYYSTNNTGSAISKVSQTVINTKPADGVRYRWTNASLPIELVSFTGEYNSGMVKLEWFTASEKGNDHFNVLRSNDAINFEQIAKVKGSGNSQTTKAYLYYDLPPSPVVDIIYYRLNQTDFDLGSSNSAIIKVSINPKEKAARLFYDQETGILKIENNLSGAEELLVEVNDIFGRSVFQKKVESQKGNDIFVITPQDFINGVYFARVIKPSGEIITQTRFIKN